MAVHFSFIKRALINSVNQFITKDIYLLEKNVSERAISHKIASYLQQEFGSFYDVDCEYNRNVSSEDGSKSIFLHNEIIQAARIGNNPVLHNLDGEAYYEFSVYPDIIVHKRGIPDRNMLIVEIKKSNSSITKDYDFCKLKAYTDSTRNNLNYKYGVFLLLNTNSKEYHIDWFKDGELKEL